MIELLSMPAEAELNDANDVNLKYPALVESIYQNHPNSRFWQEPSLIDELEKQIVLLVLADVNDDLFNSYRALKKAAEKNNCLCYERLATDLLLFYLAYTEQVAIKGRNWLFGGRIENNIGMPTNASIDAFFNASSNQARLEFLQGLSPHSPQYARLYTNLVGFSLRNNSAAPKYTAYAEQGKKLKQKDVLLSRLLISGDISSEQKKRFESENKELYSNALRSVIVSFQKRHGLKADGIIGKHTRYWLNVSHQERVRLMALNILRMQLWAKNQERTVLVNIPNYGMEYWESGKRVFESKVIVGRVERKTPLFSSKLDSIVFNPTWNVPATIMRKDILPKALSDRDYFTLHQFDVLTNWQSKEAIAANEIEWNSLTVDNFPYKLRQKAGVSNALGLYKFNTPNKNAIYLHDTPEKKLFNTQYRAYSSGCIRVQKSQQFAQLLMKKSGFSEQEYNRYNKEQKTQVVGLKKSISFYTKYQTVWVDESGLTQFRKDIYNYDKLSRSKNLRKNFYFQQQEKNLIAQQLTEKMTEAPSFSCDL